MNQPHSSDAPGAFVGLASFALVVLGALFIGQAVGMAASQALGTDVSNAASLMSSDSNRMPLLLTQLLYAGCVFLLAPWVHLRYGGNRPLLENLQQEWAHGPKWASALLVVGIVLVYLPCSGYLVAWNESWQLPANLEAAFKPMQEQLEQLTKYMVSFSSIWQYLAGMLVIAVLPAVGEELAFRGILQHYMVRLAGNNIHVGIWTTALLFSAFHLQLYGLVPRLILGALLGYLYVWSGKLYYPIIAHFINNGLTLTLMYLHQQRAVGINIEDTQVTWAVALASLSFTAFLLYQFKRQTPPSITS